MTHNEFFLAVFVVLAALVWSLERFAWDRRIKAARFVFLSAAIWAALEVDGLGGWAGLVLILAVTAVASLWRTAMAWRTARRRRTAGV